MHNPNAAAIDSPGASGGTNTVRPFTRTAGTGSHYRSVSRQLPYPCAGNPAQG